jgi:ABC-type uncharacterized transport system involved in gliding motility auxiliary subunit
VRERILDWLFTGLLLAAALLLAFLSTRFAWQHDFSYAQRASLDPRSVELLKRLDGAVAITSYAPRDNELRHAIADFVGRYRQVKPDISLAFVDPDADPAATREAGIQVNGELVIQYQNRSERLKLLTERELDNALVRLARTRAGLVAFLAGDGERAADGKANADLGQFTAFLQAQGVRAMPLNLSAGTRIPENVDVLAIAGPRVTLAPTVVAQILDYVDRGGNLLWLTEPDEHAGLEPLAKALSLHALAGTVVDGNGAALGIGDPSFIAISAYPPATITRDLVLTTLFPQAVALAAISDGRWQQLPLLRTGQKSWTQIGALPASGETATIAYDADKGEIPGPLDLGFALTRLSPSPGKREQRVVAIGDGDFLSNAFLGNGGNREFGQRVFDWLLQDDALVDLPDKGAPDRQLQLSQAQLGTLALTFLLVLPLALLLTGMAIWWRRKRA